MRLCFAFVGTCFLLLASHRTLAAVMRGNGGQGAVLSPGGGESEVRSHAHPDGKGIAQSGLGGQRREHHKLLDNAEQERFAASGRPGGFFGAVFSMLGADKDSTVMKMAEQIDEHLTPTEAVAVSQVAAVVLREVEPHVDDAAAATAKFFTDWTKAFIRDAAEMPRLSEAVKAQYERSAPTLFPTEPETLSRQVDQARMLVCYAYVAGRDDKHHKTIHMPSTHGDVNDEARAKLERRREFVAGVVGEGLGDDDNAVEGIGAVALQVVGEATGISAASVLSGNTMRVVNGAKKIQEAVKEVAGTLADLKNNAPNAVAKRLERLAVKSLPAEAQELYELAKDARSETSGKGKEVMAQVKAIGKKAAVWAVNKAITVGLNAITPGLSTMVNMGAKLAKAAAESELDIHNEFKDCVACYATASPDTILSLFPDGKFQPVFCGMDISEQLNENTPGHESYAGGATTLFLQARATELATEISDDEVSEEIREELKDLQASAKAVFIARAIKRVLHTFTASHEGLLRTISVAEKTSRGDYLQAISDGFTEQNLEADVILAFRAQLGRANAFWHGVIVGETLSTGHVIRELMARRGSDDDKRLRPFLTFGAIARALASDTGERVLRSKEDHPLRKLGFVKLLPKSVVNVVERLPVGAFCDYKRSSYSTELYDTTALPVLGLASAAHLSPMDLSEIARIGEQDHPVWLTTNVRNRIYRRMPLLARPVEIYHNLYSAHEQTRHSKRDQRMFGRVGYTDEAQSRFVDEFKSQFKSESDVERVDVHVHVTDDDAPALKARFAKERKQVRTLEGGMRHNGRARALLLPDIVNSIVAEDKRYPEVKEGMRRACKLIAANVKGSVDDSVQPLPALH